MAIYNNFYLDWNEYGFIGTVRYGVTAIYPGAIQLGQIA